MIKFLQKNSSNILLLCAFIIVFGLGFIGYQITRDILIVYKKHQVQESQTQFGSQASIEPQLTKNDVENTIKEYIMNNPGIIVDALESLQASKLKEQNEKIALKIKAKQAELFDLSKAPYFGNQKADVKIVSFIDYNCGYCKKANTALNEIVKLDPNVVVIYHLLPILGDGSEYMTKVALSVNKIAPDKFKAIHDALIENKITNKDDVAKILEANGLKFNEIEDEIEHNTFKEQLDLSTALAKYIGIKGVPGIIVDDQLFPGFLDTERLKEVINEFRAKNAPNASLDNTAPTNVTPDDAGQEMQDNTAN
jgi:protein-disulfide isomerase